jgi:protein involved in ribonucleotide reduction
MLHYALFNAHPSSEPPFVISLGVDNQVVSLADCQDISDGVQKIEQHCQTHQIELSTKFVLLYPIYMDAMNTDSETIMHNIAWLIKEEADAKNWRFDRVGGLTNLTTQDFVHN